MLRTLFRTGSRMGRFGAGSPGALQRHSPQSKDALVARLATMGARGATVPKEPSMYPYLIGLTVATGAYVFYTSKYIKQDREPYQAGLMKPCELPQNCPVVDATGRRFDLGRELCGKNVLLAFGTLHSSDTPRFESVCTAAALVTKSTGVPVTPVFFSLDPQHDTPADLQRLASSTGSPAAIVVAGPPDGLLATASKFQNNEVSRWMAASKDQEKYKKGDLVHSSGYVSDHVFQISADGRFVGLMPKGATAAAMAEVAASRLERVAQEGGGDEG